MTPLPAACRTDRDAEEAPAHAWSPPPATLVGIVPIPLTLFALAALAVSTVDAPLARARLHGKLPGLMLDVLERSETFGHGIGLFVILLAAWLLDPARRRFMPRLIACAVGAGLMADVVKLTIARLRPWAWIDQAGGTLPSQFVRWFPLGTNTSMDQSFPSAHTAAAFGLALGLSALYPRGRWLFLATAALVAAERVVFSAHYASDVLAGAGLAWLVVLGLFRNRRIAGLFDRFERSEPPRRSSPPISRAA